MQQFVQNIVFIGGGNMASAILGGLRQQGVAAQQITVVDPGLEARLRLQERYGVRALEAADASLGQADVVVWAVKPQQFREAAAAAAPSCANAEAPAASRPSPRPALKSFFVMTNFLV